MDRYQEQPHLLDPHLGNVHCDDSTHTIYIEEYIYDNIFHTLFQNGWLT